MTSPDPRVLDLTAFDGVDDRRPRCDDSELHVMRLALDLQLDALLLTLGASAHAVSRGESDELTPWRRWLVEDLDLARGLATALVDGDTVPVGGVGGMLSHGSLESSLENLTARYQSMEKLLVGLLDRPAAGQPWRTSAADALLRCRARLEELHGHRREAIAATAAADTTSLPGLWLG
jgi:hypothetical protein